ncbi:MAG TPA: sugar transferase [Edaphobacter sp.]|nr:sugar transferase [Edaphobacter sp.]
MNNSESSGATAASQAVATPQIYDHVPSWDDVGHNLLRENTIPHDAASSDGVLPIVSLNRTVLQRPINLQVAERQSQSALARLDLGVWLLRGSEVRQGCWESLRTASRRSLENYRSDLKSSPALKRTCDVLGCFSLLVILSPLFLLIAILIKVDSPGPVFFRHRRIGKDGNEFVLWKFRSMRSDVAKYAVSPQSAADKRLTRIGRMIRRLSVDELPQLINVLKGEMSMVGPRPEMPFIVNLYRSVEYERFAVRPGITGLWQISPARAFPIHENIQYDLHYIHNRNFFLDCAIILRTITAVVHGIGAV